MDVGKIGWSHFEEERLKGLQSTAGRADNSETWGSDNGLFWQADDTGEEACSL